MSQHKSKIIKVVAGTIVVLFIIVNGYNILNNEYNSTSSTLSINTTGFNNANAPMIASSTPSFDTPYTIPGNILSYLPVKLTNSQSVPTSRHFNQLVTIDSFLYQQFEASDLQNVRWFTSSGTTIPSWVSGGLSNSSTGTSYWLNVPMLIPADSSITIYLGFASISTDFYASYPHYEGVAPYVTSVYDNIYSAHYYDNGVNVFPFYDNFAGTSLNTAKWKVVNAGGGTYAVNSGITLSENTYRTEIHVVSNQRYNGIVDARVVQQNLGSYGGTGIELGTTFPTTSGFQTGYRFFASDNHPYYSSTGKGGFIYSSVSGSQTEVGYTSSYPPGTPYLMTIEWLQTGKEIWLNNNQEYITATDSSISHSPAYVCLYAGSDSSNYGTISFEYVLVRSYLPDNTMPSITTGSVLSMTNGYAGNDAVYLSTGVGGSKSPYFLGDISGSGHIQNVHSTYLKMNNSVSITSGSYSPLAGGLISSLREFYNVANPETSNGSYIEVIVPVAAVGDVAALETFTEDYSVWQTEIYATLSGMQPGSSNIYWQLQRTYDAGANISGQFGSMNSGTFDATYLGLASTGLAIIALVPGFEFLAIPSIALGLMASGESLVHPSYTYSNINSVTPTCTTNGKMSQLFNVDNGTLTYQNQDTMRNITNVFAAEELLMFKIYSPNFGNNGNINLNATNFYGDGPTDVQYGAKYMGASANINIPIKPAVTMKGKALINGTIAGNHELVITQTNQNGGGKTQFYTETNSSGDYKFFVSPGYYYSVQEVMPNGVSPANKTQSFIPYGASGTSHLNVEGSKTYITGVVSNQAGTPISGAQVTLKGNGAYLTTTTNSKGIYNFYSISETGTYTIEATYNGNLNQVNVDVNSLNYNTYTAVSGNIIVTSPAYTITFTESGLPIGLSWSVTFDGSTHTASAGSSITFSYPDNSYSFSVSSVYDQSIGFGYLPSPASGTVTVNNGNVNVQISYSGVRLGF